MKLVRDKIPQLIFKDGRTCNYHYANKVNKINWSLSEYGHRLIDKIHEEVDELAEEPSLVEAADVYEAYIALLGHLGFSLSDVKKAAKQKSKQMGKFTKGIVLEDIQNKGEKSE